VATVLLPVSAASALPPANDNFASATVITSLPFNDSVDITEATTEAGEPQLCGAAQTVWYAFTPTSDVVVRADPIGSSFFNTNLSIYQAVGPGLSDLSWLGCGSFGFPVVFDARAGTTYYVQGGSVFGGGATLDVHLEVVPPPPNDDFANAIPITTVPFSDTQDITGATTQAGEPPSSCFFGVLRNTVWYSFTPTNSGSISVETESGFSAGHAVYSGDSLGSLTELGCNPFGGFVTFHAEAGTTYYFQATPGGLGLLQLNVVVTPPPVAGFGYGPGDPSIFDTVQFQDFSNDPAGVGIGSQAWDFGDGATATGCCPTHRYPADGDYPVQLTVTTFDGRTASTSRVVQVRTTTLSCNGKPATIVGPAGDSTVIGTAGDDVIVDLSGNNKVRAKGGNDTICTGPGNEEITAGGGDDWVDAGDGRNSVEGNSGHDRLTTGSGNDELEGNGGNDTLTGGAGADKFRGGDGTDTATDFTPAEGDTKTGVEVF
jgi:Ca2+-binding RTX toxin-like protein